jgi:hypothetical protein
MVDVLVDGSCVWSFGKLVTASSSSVLLVTPTTAFVLDAGVGVGWYVGSRLSSTVVSFVSDDVGTGLRGMVSAWILCSLFVVFEDCSFGTAG